MIEATASVITTEPGYAWVETRRDSACCHCATAGTCGVSVLGKVPGARPDRFRLPNPLAACTGDRVVIGVPERQLLAAAFRAYMVPLLCMLGAALVSAQLGLSQWVVGLSGVTALAIGLAWSGAGMRRTGAATRPVMLRRVKDAEMKVAQVARE